MKEKDIDTGKEKVKKICDLLKKETLEPAHEEAARIVKEAEEKAAMLLQEARVAAEKIKQEALAEREKEKALLQSSLNQACRQSLDALREDIEHKLFSKELTSLLSTPMQDPKVISALIEAVIRAVEKDGVEANLDVMIPQTVSVEAINTCLAKNMLEKLRNHSVSIGPMQGGITVKLADDDLKIDITDEALKEWVSHYIRQDFRQRILQG